MTVGNMKVGESLVFGRYGVENQEPQPIEWLKMDSQCRFISKEILDYIMFDAEETGMRNGNTNYELSNIRQFMNSQCLDWFVPTHRCDEPPRALTGAYRHRCATYDYHPGFLNYFEDFEIECIVGELTLPSRYEILNGGAELFRRRGVRAHGTEQVVDKLRRHYMRDGVTVNSYIDYWLRDNEGTIYSPLIDLGGYCSSRLPANSSGLRPICPIDSCAEIERIEGTKKYKLKEKIVNECVFSDDEWADFFG